MEPGNTTANDIVIVVTNMPDRASATKLARALVESRLAACVNLLADIESVYRWQGKIEQAKEVPVVIKTTASAYQRVQAAILKDHPYQLPEIVAVPVVAGLEKYLQWVAGESSG